MQKKLVLKVKKRNFKQLFIFPELG